MKGRFHCLFWKDLRTSHNGGFHYHLMVMRNWRSIFILQYERDRQKDKYSPFKNYKKVTIFLSWCFSGSQKFNDIENIFCQTLQIRGHIEECSFETLDFLVYILLAYLVKYAVNIIRTTQLILHNSERVQKCLECT